jgi:hypothetical protein
VFSTFQGEGPRVGERQIFVRLARCDLRCAFCDTPDSYPTPDRARVQIDPLREGDELPENPMPVDALLAAVARLDTPRGLHRSVSITGCEPLLHPNAVRALGLARGPRAAVHLRQGAPSRRAAGRARRHRRRDAGPEARERLRVRDALGRARGEPRLLLQAAGKALAVKCVVAETRPTPRSPARPRSPRPTPRRP